MIISSLSGETSSFAHKPTLRILDRTAPMALRQPLNFSATSHAAAASSSSKELSNASGPIRLGRRRPKGGNLSAGFCDQGHVQYYKSVFGFSAATSAAGRRMTVMSGKEVKSVKEKSLKKTKKQQLKLLKGLSKDLSTFSQMGFGLDSDGTLLDQIKGNMITEATQALLEQLQRVKAEEKELKRRMKEEKARSKAAAARMKIGGNCKMSSSSSSSSSESSSESECGEVVDMSSLKRTKPGLQQVMEEETPAYPAPIIPTIPTIQIDACNATVMPAEELAEQPSSSSNVDDLGELKPSCFVAPTCSKKIEVCMGGKCKKSGAATLLEEFQRVVGIESAVSGCKCMGKCRDGPNVKVVNASDGGDMEKNSLCIGVGLEDVNVIVANFLGEHIDHQLGGFAAAT